MKIFRKPIPALILLAALWGCAVKKDPEPPEKIFPPPARDLKARVLAGCAVLSWSNAGTEPLKKLIVMRSERPGPDDNWSGPRPIAELAAGDTSFRDCGLSAGGYYRYRVLPVSAYGLKSEDGDSVAISLPRVPDKPLDFKARPGDRFVDLSWSAGPGCSYNIYRSDAGCNFADPPLNRAPLAKSAFSNVGLVNGKSYSYCLREVLALEGFPAVESECALAEAVPLDLVAPLAPQGLAAARTDSGVMLKWFASPEPDLIGYLVFRRPAGTGKWKQLTPDPIRESRYLDGSARGIKGRVEYSVRAVDNSPAGNLSAFATPEAISLN